MGHVQGCAGAGDPHREVVLYLPGRKGFLEKASLVIFDELEG